MADTKPKNIKTCEMEFEWIKGSGLRIKHDIEHQDLDSSPGELDLHP